MSHRKKDFRQMLQRLTREGLVVRHTDPGGKHTMLVLAGGQTYPCPRSPSDWRALRNMECDIRRLTRR